MAASLTPGRHGGWVLAAQLLPQECQHCGLEDDDEEQDEALEAVDHLEERHQLSEINHKLMSRESKVRMVENVSLELVMPVCPVDSVRDDLG